MWVFWGDHMVSGKTEGESFVANRVWDCKKLTTNERWGGGGCHKIITEPKGGISEPPSPRPLAVSILKKVIFLLGKDCESKYIKMVNRCGKSVKIRTKCVHAVLS